MNRISTARTLSAAFMLLLCGAALALPQNSPFQGGVAVIALGKAAQAPTAYYQDKPVLVIERDGEWLAFVGIALDAKPGVHRLRVQSRAGGDSRIEFSVAAKKYVEQHLKVAPRMVNPPAEELDRIHKDFQLAKKAFGRFTPESEIPLRFAMPVDGRYSSPFGLRRVFNGEPRNPHSGIDLAVPTGTPIRAPAPGRVIATGDLYYNGNTVYLDHGQGLVTMYCHMSRIDVKAGDEVTTGDVLGAVGATGRVTGPHLHWTFSLNNVRVDPLLFLDAKDRDRLLQP